MTFFTSTAPDVTEGLPFTLSARSATALALRTGFLYDYIINGIGFMRYPSGEVLYRRTTVPIQKQQTDTSKEAGEQTLDGFWTRSQVSWHRGAGIIYYEPGSDPDTEYRFAESQGIDVWTKGKITLLKDTEHPFTTTGVDSIFATSAVSAGVDLLILNQAGVVKRWDGTTATAYTMGSGAAATPVVVAGDTLLWGNTTGIWSGSITGTTVTQLWSQAAGTLVTPYWCKSRIIASRGADLFELTLAGGAMPGTYLYTHPAPGWLWTSITESPTAVLAAGNAAGTGAIYRFELQDAGSGSTPKLSQAYQVAEFPPGEQVYAIKVYLGRYVGIGTSRGVRVGVLDGDGNLTYGPLLVETAAPVRALAATGSFLVAGVEAGLPDGKSGAVKINLGESIGDPGNLQFAWATDAQSSSTGVVTSLAYLGNTDRLCLTITGSGAWVQSATKYVPDGWATSGRIRFNTSEPKLFRLVTGEGSIPGGSIEVSRVIGEQSNEYLLASLIPGTGSGYELGMNVPEPVVWAQLKATLRSDDDTNLLSPLVRSIQVKALPAPSAIRRISIPLAVCDFDRDPNGAQYGRAGLGWERLMAMEEVERLRQVLSVQDNITGDAFVATVEQIDFQWTGQSSGNPGGNGRPPMGGLASIVLRQL